MLQAQQENLREKEEEIIHLLIQNRKNKNSSNIANSIKIVRFLFAQFYFQFVYLLGC